MGQLSAGSRLKPGLVVDTHAALWYLAADPALFVRAAAALDAITIAGRPIYVPAICVVEAIYLAEKGRIPGTALERLLRALQEPNPRFVLAPLDWIVAISLRVNDVVISCKVAPRSLLLPARGWRPGGLRYPAAQPARPGSHPKNAARTPENRFRHGGPRAEMAALVTPADRRLPTPASVLPNRPFISA